MPSVIQKRSCGSAKIFWLDKKLLEEALRKAAENLLEADPNVEKVVLFGSLAQGRASVSSDLDLLIIVKDSQKRFIDRPLDFLDYFQEIDLNKDIFVYTKDEVQQDNPFIDRALSRGKSIVERCRGWSGGVKDEK